MAQATLLVSLSLCLSVFPAFLLRVDLHVEMACSRSRGSGYDVKGDPQKRLLRVRGIIWRHVCNTP